MHFMCVLIPFPGAGGAVSLWHLLSRDSVQVPPLCRYSAHLHPELSCTPANPPLAWWSAHKHAKHKLPAHTSAETKKMNADNIAILNVAHTAAAMFCYFSSLCSFFIHWFISQKLWYKPISQTCSKSERTKCFCCKILFRSMCFVSSELSPQLWTVFPRTSVEIVLLTVCLK